MTVSKVSSTSVRLLVLSKAELWLRSSGQSWARVRLQRVWRRRQPQLLWPSTTAHSSVCERVCSWFILESIVCCFWMLKHPPCRHLTSTVTTPLSTGQHFWQNIYICCSNFVQTCPHLYLPHGPHDGGVVWVSPVRFPSVIEFGVDIGQSEVKVLVEIDHRCGCSCSSRCSSRCSSGLALMGSGICCSSSRTFRDQEVENKNIQAERLVIVICIYKNVFVKCCLVYCSAELQWIHEAVHRQHQFDFLGSYFKNIF